MMKALFVYILLNVSLTGFCQKTDTVRIYDYLKRAEKWKLQIETKGAFVLYSNELFTRDTITAKGFYKAGDTFFVFSCDTVFDEKWGKARFRTPLFSNIQLIIKADTFFREKNIVVPKNIMFYSDDKMVPKEIFASYYRGDGFGSNEVELKKDGTYIFYDRSCVWGSDETGTWKMKNEIITFAPKENKWSMLEWITDDKKLYVIDGHLIGKKTVKSVKGKGERLVTETFFYLSKLPLPGNN